MDKDSRSRLSLIYLPSRHIRRSSHSIWQAHSSVLNIFLYLVNKSLVHLHSSVTISQLNAILQLLQALKTSRHGSHHYHPAALPSTILFRCKPTDAQCSSKARQRRFIQHVRPQRLRRPESAPDSSFALQSRTMASASCGRLYERLNRCRYDFVGSHRILDYHKPGIIASFSVCLRQLLLYREPGHSAIVNVGLHKFLEHHGLSPTIALGVCHCSPSNQSGFDS